jgi:hypothetical protein
LDATQNVIIVPFVLQAAGTCLTNNGYSVISLQEYNNLDYIDMDKKYVVHINDIYKDTTVFVFEFKIADFASAIGGTGFSVPESIGVIQKFAVLRPPYKKFFSGAGCNSPKWKNVPIHIIDRIIPAPKHANHDIKTEQKKLIN